MPLTGQIRTLIISAAIFLMGIIHLGVGIGIVAKYRQFGEVFEQQVGLCGYNIFIAFFAVILAIIGFIAVLRDYPTVIKFVAIASFALGIITLISLIAALALTGQASSHLRDTLNDNMNDYVSDTDSINLINNIQSYYQCCGLNLWLDWARVQLNPYSNIGSGRRRRESPPSLESPLVRALREKRQTTSNNGYIYNLPTSYSIYLPSSCCSGGGGVSNGNSLGTLCSFNSGNNTGSFYVNGCLVTVADTAFSQLAGLIVINTCLFILCFVYFGKLVTIFVQDKRAIEEYNKEAVRNSSYPAQPVDAQYPYNQNHTNNQNQNQNQSQSSYYSNSQQNYGYYL